MSQREEKALSLHTHGYNCAQALICSYQDILPFEEKNSSNLQRTWKRRCWFRRNVLYSYFNCYDLFLFENM